jgi:hypothetical protein
VKGSGYRLAGEDDDGYAPKAARAGLGLISEFETPRQKIAASTALVAGRIIHGAGGCSKGAQEGGDVTGTFTWIGDETRASSGVLEAHEMGVLERGFSVSVRRSPVVWAYNKKEQPDGDVPAVLLEYRRE